MVVQSTVAKWPIKKIGFKEFRGMVNKDKLEGLVLLGAGGNLDEWIDGVSGALVKEGIATGTSEQLWGGYYLLKTTGGRIDLVLMFPGSSPRPKKSGGKIDMGKMAMWRLRFGDASWVSDYIVNYAKQHVRTSRRQR